MKYQKVSQYMKNRGQALVLFVLLLPIILLMFAFVIDIGLLSYSKKSINMKIEEIIEDGLSNNLSEREIHELLIKNIKNIENKNIIKKENGLQITLQIKLNPIFPNIVKQDKYEVTYSGKINEQNINIVRK